MIMLSKCVCTCFELVILPQISLIHNSFEQLKKNVSKIERNINCICRKGECGAWSYDASNQICSLHNGIIFL